MDLKTHGDSLLQEELRAEYESALKEKKQKIKEKNKKKVLVCVCPKLIIN